jgi:hypothetical protein
MRKHFDDPSSRISSTKKDFVDEAFKVLPVAARTRKKTGG